MGFGALACRIMHSVSVESSEQWALSWIQIRIQHQSGFTHRVLVAVWRRGRKTLDATHHSLHRRTPSAPSPSASCAWYVFCRPRRSRSPQGSARERETRASVLRPPPPTPLMHLPTRPDTLALCAVCVCSGVGRGHTLSSWFACFSLRCLLC